MNRLLNPIYFCMFMCVCVEAICKCKNPCEEWNDTVDKYFEPYKENEEVIN